MCFSQLIKEQREVERLGSQGGGTGAQPPNINPPVSVTVSLVNNPVCRLQFSYQLLIQCSDVAPFTPATYSVYVVMHCPSFLYKLTH